MSAATQSRFAAALLDDRRGVPAGLVCRTGALPGRRFAIYRNNVASSLIRALAARFPVTERIVGEEFFVSMSRAFIEQHPPTSPVLLTFGDRLAEFVETFEPAHELVYLPDIIRLEVARAHAYHAADMAPLEPREIASVPLGRLGDLVLDTHPSACVACAPYPAITIWAMNSGEAELGPIDDWAGEDALVIRPHQHVLIHRLPAGGAAFLGRLMAGAPLDSAAEVASAETEGFDVAANFAVILTAGVIVGIRESALQGDAK